MYKGYRTSETNKPANAALFKAINAISIPQLKHRLFDPVMLPSTCWPCKFKDWVAQHPSILVQTKAPAQEDPEDDKISHLLPMRLSSDRREILSILLTEVYWLHEQERVHGAINPESIILSFMRFKERHGEKLVVSGVELDFPAQGGPVDLLSDFKGIQEVVKQLLPHRSDYPLIITNFINLVDSFSVVVPTPANNWKLMCHPCLWGMDRITRFILRVYDVMRRRPDVRIAVEGCWTYESQYDPDPPGFDTRIRNSIEAMDWHSSVKDYYVNAYESCMMATDNLHGWRDGTGAPIFAFIRGAIFHAKDWERLKTRKTREEFVHDMIVEELMELFQDFVTEVIIATWDFDCVQGFILDE